MDPLNHILRKPDLITQLEQAEASVQAMKANKARMQATGNFQYRDMVKLEQDIEWGEDLVRRLKRRSA